MVNKTRLVKLLQNLIKIDSQNPPGDESRIARFVGDYLRKLGMKVKIYEFRKKRSNVVATWEGRDKKRSLLLTPHLDTVPAGKSWKFPPFSGLIRKGMIYGLGATDCKGNLASGMEAINSLVEEGEVLGYNLIFAATADEESGSDWGLVPLLEKGALKPDAVLVLDADDFEIVVTQKGLMHLKVKIRGKKAHGAYPWLGVNAIDLAVNALQELKSWKPASAPDKYLHPPTVNIGTIKGGDKVNVVAESCEFELDFRFLPGTSEKTILKKLREILRRKAGNFSVEIEGIQAPYRISEGHPLVGCLREAMRRSGVKAAIRGSEGATTISFFQKRRIPAIATGFGAEGCAHMADEYAKIDNLYKGAQILERFLRDYEFKGGK